MVRAYVDLLNTVPISEDIRIAYQNLVHLISLHLITRSFGISPRQFTEAFRDGKP
jgi:hypothetical protein